MPRKGGKGGKGKQKPKPGKGKGKGKGRGGKGSKGKKDEKTGSQGSSQSGQKERQLQIFDNTKLNTLVNKVKLFIHDRSFEPALEVIHDVEKRQRLTLQLHCLKAYILGLSQEFGALTLVLQEIKSIMEDYTIAVAKQKQKQDNKKEEKQQQEQNQTENTKATDKTVVSVNGSNNSKNSNSNSYDENKWEEMLKYDAKIYFTVTEDDLHYLSRACDISGAMKEHLYFLLNANVKPTEEYWNRLFFVRFANGHYHEQPKITQTMKRFYVKTMSTNSNSKEKIDLYTMWNIVSSMIGVMCTSDNFLQYYETYLKNRKTISNLWELTNIEHCNTLDNKDDSLMKIAQMQFERQFLTENNNNNKNNNNNNNTNDKGKRKSLTDEHLLIYFEILKMRKEWAKLNAFLDNSKYVPKIEGVNDEKEKDKEKESRDSVFPDPYVIYLWKIETLIAMKQWENVSKVCWNLIKNLDQGCDDWQIWKYWIDSSFAAAMEQHGDGDCLKQLQQWQEDVTNLIEQRQKDGKPNMRGPYIAKMELNTQYMTVASVKNFDTKYVIMFTILLLVLFCFFRFVIWLQYLAFLFCFYISISLSEAILQYFEHFGHKRCCFDDIKPYINQIVDTKCKESILDKLKGFVNNRKVLYEKCKDQLSPKKQSQTQGKGGKRKDNKGGKHHNKSSSKHQQQQQHNKEKDANVKEQEESLKLLSYYCHCLTNYHEIELFFELERTDRNKLYNKAQLMFEYWCDYSDYFSKFEKTEWLPIDGVLIIAVEILYYLCMTVPSNSNNNNSKKNRKSYLIDCIFVLEQGLIKSQDNYEMKLWLIRIYNDSDIGLLYQSFSKFESLHVRSTQLHSMSYLMLHDLYRLGCMKYVRSICQDISEQHRDLQRAMLTRGKDVFLHSKYTKCIEFAQFNETCKLARIAKISEIEYCHSQLIALSDTNYDRILGFMEDIWIPCNTILNLDKDEIGTAGDSKEQENANANANENENKNDHEEILNIKEPQWINLDDCIDVIPFHLNEKSNMNINGDSENKETENESKSGSSTNNTVKRMKSCLLFPNVAILPANHEYASDDDSERDNINDKNHKIQLKLVRNYALLIYQCIKYCRIETIPKSSVLTEHLLDNLRKYLSYFKLLIATGKDGFWTDMNEFKPNCHFDQLKLAWSITYGLFSLQLDLVQVIVFANGFLFFFCFCLFTCWA